MAQKVKNYVRGIGKRDKIVNAFKKFLREPQYTVELKRQEEEEDFEKGLPIRAIDNVNKKEWTALCNFVRKRTPSETVFSTYCPVIPFTIDNVREKYGNHYIMALVGVKETEAEITFHSMLATKILLKDFPVVCLSPGKEKYTVDIRRFFDFQIKAWTEPDPLLKDQEGCSISSVENLLISMFTRREKNEHK